MSQLVRTRAELAAALAQLPGPPVLVATMGALHAGHLALLSAAGPGAVLSLFVNPLQFGDATDLARYPRTLAADLSLAEQLGVAVVFAPTVEEVYPAGRPQVSVAAGPLGEVWEGASRPGHFDGVLTVVAKLFGLIRPARAMFGEKDFQQLQLVRRMVGDLELDVEIVGVGTVREPDGLALSSRNRLLGAAQRAAASALPAALATGDPHTASRLLAAAEHLELDYCALVDPVTLVERERGPGRLIAAVRAGEVRLIDNVAVPCQ